MNKNFFLKQKQLGVTFVTGLIFLVVLTLLGITAMKTATIEERMSGNLRDRNLALQAAEMTLRYVEQHIRDDDPATNAPNPIDGLVGFDTVCTGGYCYYGSGVADPGIATPAASARAVYCTPACPINYVPGMVFNAGGIGYTAPVMPVGVPAPTYLIEGIKKTPPGSSSVRYYYRITVRAQGAKPGTVVWLQEIFRP